ncbi:hypothetical protein NQ317_016953 [Molorchus minor]|uniref:Nucleolar protein 14 n=1 Tax=Molorchus minor TaxID=1323400 RepID=A0ABQ9K665_9CUCU|nr:hypothetical protein NQ317_016953 [Molorchus minor]
MTNEDKAIARFTAVRVNAHKKKNIFNLADDEVLTHKGQTINEIEKFDDPRSDNESFEEDDSGKLDKKFVEDAHFGGGLLRNTGTEGAKSHKQLIDELIAESKKRKAEKQKTKENTLELTEKLDSEWKELLPLVSKIKKSDDKMEKPSTDDYDKVMRELRFEARGTVSDRLKTEDEIAKEEKEKLDQLEKDRLERMKGNIKEIVSKSNHRSADDLEDDFVYESDTEYTLSYNDKGESNVQIDAKINGTSVTKNVDGLEEDTENENQSDKEIETDSEDNMSDLKEESSESENETENEEKEEKTGNNRKRIKRTDTRND